MHNFISKIFFTLVCLLCVLTTSAQLKLDSLYGLMIENPNASIAYALEFEGKLPEKSYENAFLNRSLGGAYRSLGENEKALQYYFDALDLTTQLNEDSLTAVLYRSISNVYLFNKAFDNAIEFALKGIALCNQTQNRIELGTCYEALGRVYSAKSNLKPDSAQKYYELAQQLYNESDHEALGRLYNNWGMFVGRLGQFDKAEDYFEQSLFHKKQHTGHINGVLTTYNNLGIIYAMVKKQPQRAIDEYFKVGLKYKDNLKSTMRLERSISLAYYDLNQLDSAIHYTNRYLESYKSYLENLRSDEMSRLKAEYDVKQFEQESASLRKSNRQKSGLLSLAGLVTLVIAFASFQSVRKIKTEKALELANLQNEQQRMSVALKDAELQYISGILQGQENERKRIAQDLHDRLGVMLSTSKMHFNALETQPAQLNSDAQRSLDYGVQIIDDACKEIRIISSNLSLGTVHEYGLKAAILFLKEKIEQTNTVLNVDIFGLDKRLPSSIEISIYRSIQEMVSNTIKHAKATVIDVQMVLAEDRLNIIYEDNGTGFNPDKIRSKGIGLNNIKTRIQQLNGELELQTSRGEGVRYTIQIPIHHD